MTLTWMWILFNLFVLGMLALDLGVFHRESHEVSVKESVSWTVVWIALALAFAGLVYVWRGQTPALEFLTGYVIEKALSVDNIFVFVLIFQFFRVPRAYQHRVLFWGVLGALVMRAALIAVGSVLIARFHWLIYVFGAFLVYTGIKMAVTKHEDLHPNDNPVVRLVRRVMPVSDQYHGQDFIVRRDGRWIATPLLLVLVMAETSDLIFAFDSIPAIFAVTTDAFIVYTSNVFAIMGLRALYFLLAGVIDQFRYLKFGLSLVLTFVGAKMLAGAVGLHLPIPLSLAIILGVVLLSVLLSVLIPEEGRPRIRS
ncbi:MAG TPA: TerC family protein [Symbiobacteriaceae bacterium]|nr:TerC family protein [Symbiobacteriaceae bacterium]